MMTHAVIAALNARIVAPRMVARAITFLFCVFRGLRDPMYRGSGAASGRGPDTIPRDNDIVGVIRSPGGAKRNPGSCDRRNTETTHRPTFFVTVLLKATDPGFRHSALKTRVNALFPPGLRAAVPLRALPAFS